jgi:adenosine kinase
MKSPLLVTGSLAFDRIAVFPDRFSNHILKGHVHNLNVSFTVKDMRVDFGGTGGNIAYNLALIGEKPLLMAAAGSDARAYLAHLKKKKVDLTYVTKFPKVMTASATIMTDLDDNQITSFHAGAMEKASRIKISSLKEKPAMAVIAPDNVKAMQNYSEYCFKNGVLFIADPGQGIPAFSSDGLREFITGAEMLVVSDYEWEMLQDKTGWDLKTVLDKVNFLIVTYGAQGSKIWCRDATVLDIPAYKAKKVVDPTGSGDAYRAGLVYGYRHGFDIEKSAHIGAWLAAKCVETKGTQNHRIQKKEFRQFLKYPK